MAEKLAAGDTSQNLHEVMIALQGQRVFPGNGSGPQQARYGLSGRDEHPGLM
jgi:hypothetical protein